MRFLVDESMGNTFAALLKKAGYDTVFVGDALPEAIDEHVLDFAVREKRVLVTADKDFGKLVVQLKICVNGVILFRTATRKPERRIELGKSVLDKAEGKFIVIKEGQIRVRKIDG
jgi:predicted nuclease of predicted toxin-antitoxin system